MSEARKIASKYLFETDPDWALLVADIDALVEKAARVAEGWTFCGIESASTTREAALWEVAAWHQTQAKEARRIIRETAGEVSMAHAAAAATHSSSAAAILALIPQPAAQPSREAPGLKCAIDIANERIATIRHRPGRNGAQSFD